MTSVSDSTSGKTSDALGGAREQFGGWVVVWLVAVMFVF
jgi:hypothetical protein